MKKKNLIILIVSIICILSVLATPLINSKKNVVLAGLSWAILEEKAVDYKYVHGEYYNKYTIIVSKENLDKLNLPKYLKQGSLSIKNVEVIYLTPKEIQERANKDGDFMYLRLVNIETNILTAKLTVASNWAQSNNSKATYLSGGAAHLSLARTLTGKWVVLPFEKRYIS